VITYIYGLLLPAYGGISPFVAIKIDKLTANMKSYSSDSVYIRNKKCPYLKSEKCCKIMNI